MSVLFQNPIYTYISLFLYMLYGTLMFPDLCGNVHAIVRRNMKKRRKQNIKLSNVHRISSCYAYNYTRESTVWQVTIFVTRLFERGDVTFAWLFRFKRNIAPWGHIPSHHFPSPFLYTYVYILPRDTFTSPVKLTRSFANV